MDFYENLSKNPKFGYKRTKVLDTSHEDPSQFHTVGSDIRSATSRQRIAVVPWQRFQIL
jgi:hypothetical protein